MVQKEVEVTRGKVRSARRMVELVPGHVVSRCCLRTGIVENESQLLSHKRRDFQQFVPYKTSTKNLTTINSDLKIACSSSHWLKIAVHASIYDQCAIYCGMARNVKSFWMFTKYIALQKRELIFLDSFTTARSHSNTQNFIHPNSQSFQIIPILPSKVSAWLVISMKRFLCYMTVMYALEGYKLF